MVTTNHHKGKSHRIDQENTYEQNVAHIKHSLFNYTYLHLRENQSASPYFYYCMVLLEQLSLLWFVLHPGLGIYGSVYVMGQLQGVVQILNFQEFLSIDASLYQPMLIACMIFALIKIILMVLSALGQYFQKQGEALKYIRKCLNILFLLTCKVLTGPILGLCVSVLYCQEESPYHTGQTCYNATYMVFCLLAAILAIITLFQNVVFGLIYYFRNPLSNSYLGQPNRYYMISKTIIKIVLPVYFNVDYNLSLANVYIFCLAGFLGAYLFFHRLFSIHSYNQRHFYIEYFLEVTLFWLALNNIIIFYAQGGEDNNMMSLIYTLICSTVVALLLCNLQRTAEMKFVEECLEGRIKKQNMQKFLFILIDKFFHSTRPQSRLTFRVYSKILAKRKQEQEQITPTEKSGDDSDLKQAYSFLVDLASEYLEQNSSTALKSLRCFLLCEVGLKSLAIHQSLQLQESRLGLVEQFMMFQFRKEANIFGKESDGGESRAFDKYYQFNQCLNEMEENIELCAFNNRQYWEQLGEGDPSIAKVRNLASIYQKYFSKIRESYIKISDIFPNNIHASQFYFQFLLHVGVDIRQALRVKEKLEGLYEARGQENATSQNQYGMSLDENQHLGVVTLDTVGNNLGVIMNCNSEVRQFLGYQRNEIIGKNVTKLMPKIYAQMHNSFVLNFIKSEHSHKRPSQKFISALDKGSRLVDMLLSIRMISNHQSTLSVIGFMKKMPVKANTALLMCSASTGEVFAVDANFLQMMRYRLSPKQIVQEQVKLSALMPQLNLQKFQKEGPQETLLQVGNIVEEAEGLEVQLTKRVRVQIKHFKMYEGVKIVFLSISEIQEDLGQKYGVGGFKINPNRRASRENVSLMMSEFQEGVVAAGEGLSSQLPMARKIEDAVNQRGAGFLQLILRGFYAACLGGCTILSVFLYISHTSELSRMYNYYGQINQTLDVAYQQAQVNLNVLRLWDTTNMNYNSNPTLRVQYQTWLQSHLQTMKSETGDLTKITQQYDYDLEYNRFNYYDFQYSSTAPNQTTTLTSISQTSLDGFSEYIIAATIFLDPSINDASTIESRFNLQKQALFVLKNGESLLPQIQLRATNQYVNLFMSNGSSYLMRVGLEKAALLVMSVGCLIGILVLGNRIHRVNIQIVDIYRSIRLWDINQMVVKCDKFLTFSRCNRVPPSKQRNSSLLKIFPFQALLQVIQIGKDSEMLSIKPEEKGYLKNQERGEQEEKMIKSPESQQLVSLEMQPQSRKKAIGILVFAGILMAMIGLSLFLMLGDFNTLYSQINRLESIGLVRKHLIFLCYYSYRIVVNPSDEAALALLTNEISQFYDNTDTSYQYLGDPYPILKNIYSSVEIIQQVYMQGLSMQNYLATNLQIFTATSAIISLDLATFYPQFMGTIAGSQQKQLIFTILFILFFAIALFFIDCFYVEHIRIQRDHSLNMLRILPPWLVRRNWQLRKYMKL